MKNLILIAGLLFNVMIITSLNAQDGNTDPSDHPATANPVNESAVSPQNTKQQFENKDVEDGRERMQDNAEEKRSAMPSSAIDSTANIPDANAGNTVNTSEGLNNDLNNERASDTISSHEDDVTEAERGLGTNSSDSNINYRTGMPSNTTTPEQLKDK